MAPIFKIAALLNLSLYVAAQGTQFITGDCTADADCASGCCGFNSGKCAGPAVAQERDGGCGFGNDVANDDALQALNGGGGNANAAADTADAGNNNNNTNDTGNADAAAGGQGTQFITGDCTADADCASGCCGFNSGKCAGPAVAQERDGGCGFGNDVSNDDALQALNGGNANTANANNNNDAQAQSQDAGNGAGGQFITGPCASDADCDSGCCGFNSGTCAGPVVAQERDGGCGFGDDEPNDDAAQALQGRSFGRRGVAFM